MTDVAGEAFVQAASLLFEPANFDLHTGGAEPFESTPAYQGVGIGHGGDHSGDSSRNHRLSAWRRTAMMRAGFQIDVECSTPGFAAGLFYGANFRVRHAFISVSAGADDCAVCVDNYDAH